MHSQPSLPGFDAPLQAIDRLFFAILPDAEAAGKITQCLQDLRGKQHLNGNAVEAERFHISLHHIGDFAGLPPDILAMADKAAKAASARASAFEVVFDRVMSFAGRPGNHPSVLRGSDGLGALSAFHQTLGTEMRLAGLKFKNLHFTPHLTLLYGDRLTAEQTIDPIAWTVRELVLVRSFVGLKHYEFRARWPLQSEEQ